MPAHQVVRASRIVGVFRGYRAGRVYELADGSRWRQESMTNEYAYRENPAARILTDAEWFYLDVDGTSGVVRVSREGATARDRSGSY
jgi:hypothetical protein